jgi:hypothetical protein
LVQKEGMQLVTHRGLDLWQFEGLADEKAIRHFITSRRVPQSANEFTLSYSSTPNRDLVEQHRKKLAEAIGVTASNLFIPSQVHGTNIAVVNTETVKDDIMETDALITNVQQVAIAVLSADCVPILLFDRRNMVIGAIHAGWRGTVAKIVGKTLNKMNELFGTRGRDLIAAIGPSVCQESYEVGEDVIHAVYTAFGRDHYLLRHLSNGKAKLDLWEANRLQLLSFGVPAEMIEISNFCTVKRNTDFFSARMGDTGRFAAGISLV